MPGIVGGVVDSDPLTAMAASMRHEDWYEVEDLRAGRFGLASVNHGDHDPGGHAVWRGEGKVGVLHGAITNLDELGWSLGEAFGRVLDRPDDALPMLDGPFLLACADRSGPLVVATDKLATRPCYYATGEGLLFGTELKAVLTQLDDVDLDVQAASDMLLMGYVIGEKTLVSQVRSLPPASYLECDEGSRAAASGDGDVTVTTYWRPDFDRTATTRSYVDTAVERYRDAVGRTVDTVAGDLGLWLSGGLDSRTMAAALDDELDSFETFTYDAYSSADTENAVAVAEALELPHTLCEYTAKGCLDAIEYGVELTDGMHQWSYAVNLPSARNDVPRDVDVLLEASGQDEFFGDVMSRDYLRNKSPVEALYRLKRQLAAEEVTSLLNPDVTPRDSFTRLVSRSPFEQPEHVALDASWEVFANVHFRGNKLYRSQAGTRVPLADGAFLDHAARMPIDDYRRRTMPLTDGEVPMSVSPLKLEVMRRIGPDVSDIPYDRTGVAPNRSLAAHDVSYVATQVKNRVFGAAPSAQCEWYRHNSKLNGELNDLLDAACDRDLFDADAVRDVQQAHLDGEADRIRAISAITTLELWRQKYVDVIEESVATPSATVTMD